MSTLQTANLKNASSGSNNIVLATDGSTTITTLNSTTITGTSVRGVITSGTAVASTSGTSIDFTSIPSWVKRVTVMFSGVSTNGISNPLIQIGTSSGIQSTGYLCTGGSLAAAIYSNYTTGFGINAGAATNLLGGSFVLSLLDQSTGMWTISGGVGRSDGAGLHLTYGSKTLSGTLDRLRITTVNGTDTFDAGSINILYEG